MSTNLQWIGFLGKPIYCKIVDSGLFPTDTIYAYFDLSDFLLIYVFFQDVSI